MPNRDSFGQVQLDVSAGSEREVATPESDTPFRIAILGDFSGRANRHIVESGEALAKRRPILIDRDNFDSVFAKLAPRLDLVLGDEGEQATVLKFGELDDFHPDRLFQQAQLFRKLRDTRDKLSDSATFAETAQELGIVRNRPSPPPPTPARQRVSNADVAEILSGNILDQMAEETEARGDQGVSRGRDEWASFIQKIVAPHVVAKADPRQAEAVSLIDEVTSGQMRALLHLPPLQALEAAWRAVFLLVRHLETGERLKVFLIDVSKEELVNDLSSSPDLSATGLYRLLVERTVGTPGAEPWAVLAGNYTFEPSVRDASLLERLAKVAAAAGAPFLAAASMHLLGCESIGDLPDPRRWTKPPAPEAAAAWKALRSRPESRYAGLALPRFLLRLPYGKDTDPTELFEFEELSEPGAHDDYLWGNPAFAMALLLGQAFTEESWNLRPGVISEIGGLPIHIYAVEGESITTPCAEVLMTQTAAERMMDLGFMPLASLKNQPAVRLVRFQSFAEPLRGLGGRWSG